MIKACFIIKYPPIQGGVSRQGYWLARNMAEQGHQIHVVTNANEVEDEYRMYMDESDREWYEPRFAESGGFVRVRSTQPRNPRALAHIPYTNPFVTKLASIATQVVRRQGCEVIYAHYLQPYGLAAYLASLWTGKPFMVRHAGSDLGRLMRQRELATAYREVFKAAAAVWTGLSDPTPFVAMGVREEDIWNGRVEGVPRIFSPEAEPLDLNALLGQMSQVPTEHVRGVLTNTRPIDTSKPTIGIYGKVGEVKGSFDLVSALGALKREGLDFNFVALTQGRAFQSFTAAVREHGLEERTWTFPFIPHWRVPGFLRACTAVCFLERDFPISFHGPGIPKEILACGTCLILSGEIAAKQRVLGPRFADGENVLLVADPKDHPELERQLRLVIRQPERAREIGLKGRGLLTLGESRGDGPRRRGASTEAFAEQLRAITERHRPAAAPAAAAGAADDREGLLKSRLPCVSALLNGNWERLVDVFCREQTASADNRFSDAVRFCEFVEGQLGSLPGLSDYLGDALKYEKHTNLLYTNRHGLNDGRPEEHAPAPIGVAAPRSFAESDRHPVRRDNLEELLRLRPTKQRGVRVETFNYDMAELARRLAHDGDPGDLPPERTFILFKKEPNFIGVRVELSEGSKRLFDYCDGKHSVRDIIAGLPRQLGGGEVNDELIAALRELTTLEVIRWGGGERPDGRPQGGAR